METRDMPKGLGLFYAVFLTIPLYIQWYQLQYFVMHGLGYLD